MAAPVRREIEVYHVHAAVLWASIFVALLLQMFLPIKIPLARLFDFPLLVTIYFVLAKRSRNFGTALGTMVGLLQDAFCDTYRHLGMYGMAKALAGYIAVAASFKFDFDRMIPRLFLTAACVLIHGLFYAGLEQVLLESPPPFHPLDLASAILVNVALALVIFRILDRFGTVA
jgi:rod shape-determining protein MreD